MKNRIISAILFCLIVTSVAVYLWDIWSLATNNGTASFRADQLIQFVFWGFGPLTMTLLGLAVPLLLFAVLHDTRTGHTQRPLLSTIATYLAIVGVARPVIGLIVILFHL